MLAAGLVALNILMLFICQRAVFWEKDKNYTVKMQAAAKAAAAAVSIVSVSTASSSASILLFMPLPPLS